jgi:hypothetical protein
MSALLLLLLLPFAPRTDSLPPAICCKSLRPQFNVAYEQPQVITPNVDRLAASAGAVTFLHAHVQFALCGPSRNCEYAVPPHIVVSCC